MKVYISFSYLILVFLLVGLVAFCIYGAYFLIVEEDRFIKGFLALGLSLFAFLFLEIFLCTI